ncbi:MAG: type II toxin-antitoxin system VapC family toxin [Bacteroidota bacterium]
MNRIVLDVSAAVGLVTDREDCRWMLPFVEQSQQIISPDLFISEITNTVWKFFHIGNASLPEIHLIAETGIGLVDEFTDSQLLWPQALVLAYEMDHSAYDCFYLALCQQAHASLLTLDQRLIRLSEKWKISVLQPTFPL